ncbi:hypothetical protein MMC25_004488 [Agyrium rufum]|nr:hypothetical protein [Agyrium rufum]
MDRFLPTVSGFAATGRTVDVYPLFNFYTLDAVAAYKFGLRNGSNSIMDYERASQWFATYHGRKNWMFYVGEIPAITGALGKIGIQIIPQHVIDAMMKFDAWEFAMVDRTEKAENELADDDVHPEHIPVVYRQLKSQVIAESKKDTSPLPIRKTTIRDYVTSELIDATSAGHETAAITLTYLFYELSKTPVTQAALRKEVLGLSTPIVSPRSPVDKGPEKQDFPTAKALDSLPYLQACIMETLRLHPAVPGPQPRVTPSDCTLGPYAHLPAGVRVSAQAYSLHRNPTVFPQPESWIPERWLPSSPFVRSAEEFEPMKAEMLRWFWAFSSGGRMCVGSNLAMAMMKAVTAAVAGNFRVELVNDDGIEEEDAFTAHPKGGKCELRFVRWEST